MSQALFGIVAQVSATRISDELGLVWDRGLGKRDAYKRNAAPTPLLAFWRPHVETAVFSAIGGSTTRIQRRTFGGCILLLFFC